MIFVNSHDKSASSSLVLVEEVGETVGWQARIEHFNALLHFWLVVSGAAVLKLDRMRRLRFHVYTIRHLSYNIN